MRAVPPEKGLLETPEKNEDREPLPVLAATLRSSVLPARHSIPLPRLHGGTMWFVRA